jgi:hypothetical protein
MDTLYAIAVIVGTLKAHAAPAPQAPNMITTEHREVKTAKPPARHRPDPSLGF